MKAMTIHAYIKKIKTTSAAHERALLGFLRYGHKPRIIYYYNTQISWTWYCRAFTDVYRTEPHTEVPVRPSISSPPTQNVPVRLQMVSVSGSQISVHTCGHEKQPQAYYCTSVTRVGLEGGGGAAKNPGISLSQSRASRRPSNSIRELYTHSTRFCKAQRRLTRQPMTATVRWFKHEALGAVGRLPSSHK